MSGTESDSDASSIDSDTVRRFRVPDLTSTEERVFDVVSKGNTSGAQALLTNPNSTFDFNSMNILVMMPILLKHSNYTLVIVKALKTL